MADVISNRAAQLYRDLKEGAVSREDAVKEILVMVRRPILSHIYRNRGYTLSAQDREDLYSETLLKFIRSRLDFSKVLLMPWLRRVARNVVIDRLRQLGRREEFEFDELNAEHGLSLHPAQERLVLSNTMETAISDLPQDLQEVLDLCFREGMTAKEAAERLGKDPATIQFYRSKIKEALLKDKRLQSFLKQGTTK